MKKQKTRDTKRIILWKDSLETGFIALGLGASLGMNALGFIVLILAIWNKWLSWELTKK